MLPPRCLTFTRSLRQRLPVNGHLVDALSLALIVNVCYPPLQPVERVQRANLHLENLPAIIASAPFFTYPDARAEMLHTTLEGLVEEAIGIMQADVVH